MGLSMAQKHLITGLRIFGVEKDAIVGIVSMLPNPAQLDAMMEWMCQNEGAKATEVMKKATELAKM